MNAPSAQNEEKVDERYFAMTAGEGGCQGTQQGKAVGITQTLPEDGLSLCVHPCLKPSLLQNK